LTPTQAPIVAKIDIKPGTFPNVINVGSNATIAVGILTTSVSDGDPADFDPWDELDRTTLRFGPDRAAPQAEPIAKDVDGDGDIDMLVHFKTRETDVTCGSTQLGIAATTYDGIPVIGSDSIVTTGCSASQTAKTPGEHR
jgi:hypothetical protein